LLCGSCQDENGTSVGWNSNSSIVNPWAWWIVFAAASWTINLVFIMRHGCIFLT
jgi:hypothetical protein